MLKTTFYGQNDGLHGPDVALTGDPGVDNPTLLNAGFLGGRIVALKTSATASRGNVLILCDAATMTPLGHLLNGPGENSGAIGPSGSRKMAVVKAMPTFYVDTQAYVASPTLPYAVGKPLYCGSGANAGLLTSDVPTAGGSYVTPVGIITDIPTATNPWLGVSGKL